MNKLIRIAQTYLLYALPFVILCMIWGSLSAEREILGNSSFFIKALWEVLSWNLMIWFAILIFYLVTMVTFPEVREKTLRRLANMSERDEREQFITGQASRSAYLATLSLLIFMLFFSIFTLNLKKVPADQAIDGKEHTISIGLHLNLLDKNPAKSETTTGEVLFESMDLPLSKTALLLILILWQLAAFNISARKEQGLSERM